MTRITVEQISKRPGVARGVRLGERGRPRSGRLTRAERHLGKGGVSRGRRPRN
ncbi:hypothetical protein KKC08_03675 [Patescibacteria group bacterium]|nr:hypothetical protein [Patescibacteria group bacterium]MCG2702040.1 hypothetical protein [Candidatus Parcubacteria bacterium]MBU4265559.1 hypothetical protein [Patescibacteria group bacterium]MBU4389888.1 hypothetical protein [Patescibacteria group bacterium]MBU4397239.1 hypothetical protein [Patescibacteria group bacterium]